VHSTKQIMKTFTTLFCLSIDDDDESYTRNFEESALAVT